MIEIMYKATIEMVGKRVKDKEALSHILLRMEEEGMLPPPIVQYGTYEGIIEHGKVIPECESEDKFRWESEDEAK